MTDVVPAPVLLDLDPELLLVAVQFLPAADQGRAAQACKLLAILVHEIGRTKSFMVGAVAPIDGAAPVDIPVVEQVDDAGTCVGDVGQGTG